MATTQATTVGTSATEIYSSATPFTVAGSASVVVSNAGATDMFIGGSTVAASGTNAGVIVKAGQNLPLPALSGGLYAVVSAGSTTAVVGIF